MEKDLFNIYDYKEACEFLQDKYGIPLYNYYTKDNDGNIHRTNTKNKKEGLDLEVHHIEENKIPALYKKIVAQKYINDHPETQEAKNLCYCNIFEHAWLHLLIAMYSSDICEESDVDVELGIGGARILIQKLNTFYEKMNNQQLKIWEKLIDTYCNNCFIRSKFGKNPAELADEILMDISKDKINKNALNNINQIATRSHLFDYNVNCFCDLEHYLSKDWSALVYICPCGGKTTTALEYIRIHNLKAKTLILAPNTNIIEGWEKEKDQYRYDLEIMTFQAFMNLYDKKDWNKYKLIVADESHHAEAVRWGEGIAYAHAQNPNLKLIGLTATPTNNQTVGDDKYFEGRVCNGLTLVEGIKDRYLHPFSYISALYTLDSIKEDYKSILDTAEGKRLIGRLNLTLNQNPINKILTDNMPDGVRKIIVFCASIKDIPEAQKIMCLYDSKYNDKNYLRVITSREPKDDVIASRKWFNDTSDHDVCLITVSMVNEGSHYEGVNTLIMFRNTKSSTLFTQQLGRVLCPTFKPDPHGIVFDFTNNVNNISEQNSAKRILLTNEETNKIKEVLNVLKEKAANKQIIYKDYTSDVVDVLSALLITKNINAQQQRIIDVCNSLQITNLLDIFSDTNLNSWRKVKSKNTQAKKCIENSNSNNKHSNKKSTAETAENENNKANNNKITDTEILYKIIKLIISKAFIVKAIKFNNNCELDYIDNSGLKIICDELGVINYEKIIDIIKALKLQTYLIATK